jgi:hypothetical protein
MMDFLSSLFKPYSYNDYLQDKNLETAAKQGVVVGTATPVNSSMPWYITATLVVVGGVLIYRFGAKLLKV